MGREKELTKTSCTLNNRHSDLSVRISAIFGYILLTMGFFPFFFFFSLMYSPCPSLSLQIWVRKTSDSTKMRIYLGQLQRGVFVIRRRSAAWLYALPWSFFFSCFLLKPIEKLPMGNGSLFTLILEAENTVITSYETVCGWPHYPQ